MSNVIDRQLGEFGEQEVEARLSRALLGTGFRFSGYADNGIDGIIQFESPTSDRQPLHLGVQVKTGESFATDVGGRWRLRHIDRNRLAQWSRSRLPVLLVWVRPTRPPECYWTIIRRDSTPDSLTISRRAIVTPSLRYTLWYDHLREFAEDTTFTATQLRAPLSRPLRPCAKEYYRSHLADTVIQNPVFGDIRFTWKGWRHLTRLGRRASHIHQSLQLLPAARDAVFMARRFIAVRNLSRITRGDMVTEVRLLAIRGPVAEFANRAPAKLAVVLRERVSYPREWRTNVTLHMEVQRELSFESIYERSQGAQHAASRMVELDFRRSRPAAMKAYGC